MNRILDIGYPLRLGNNEEPFIIKDILGKGASSVTYLAECNQTEHVLKECNPLGLHMHRDDNGVLVPDTELNEKKFKECLERFESGLDKQLAFRMTNTLKNPTSNVQKKHCANGTVYIDMTYFEGCTYDQVEFESLFDVLKRMKALSKIVDGYHKEGYLHLDIKPQNIFAIPETPEMVMMFDFDSIIAEEDVKDENQIFLSYTDAWAAPEQKMAKYRKSICKATDLFAIGEIIFHRVMGRHSCADERFDFSKYAYDREAKIFENVNPRVFRALDDLFHKTLCCAPANRIQTADELIVLLDEIIPLADSQKPFLISNLPTPKEFFIGREEEIENIHSKLQENPILFLYGMGGIGKSELVKNYAKKYRAEYDTIIFSICDKDMISVIGDIHQSHIGNFPYYPDESLESFMVRQDNIFHQLIQRNCTRILFIIDNFSTCCQEELHFVFNEIKAWGCRVIITSRTDYTNFGFSSIKINPISNHSIINQLFTHYYTKSLSNEDQKSIDEIIRHVDNHTMVIELLAKQMMASRITPQNMIDSLMKSGITEIGQEMIESDKDDSYSTMSTYKHIKVLFDLSELKTEEKCVLSYLSIVPLDGIESNIFVSKVNLGSYDTINMLVKCGWILRTISRENEMLSLHPIVREIIQSEIYRKYSRKCLKLKKYIRKHEYIKGLSRHGLHSIIFIKRGVLGETIDKIMNSNIAQKIANNKRCENLFDGRGKYLWELGGRFIVRRFPMTSAIILGSFSALLLFDKIVQEKLYMYFDFKNQEEIYLCIIQELIKKGEDQENLIRELNSFAMSKEDTQNIENLIIEAYKTSL